MNGKRFLILVFLILTLIMISACGKDSDTQSSGLSNKAGTGTENVTKNLEPGNTNTSAVGASPEEVLIDQENEVLPDASFLSSYPGVLKCMSLTLEKIISVLGTNFELYENSAQGYDVYQFSDYNIVLEYDTIGEKLSTIWVDNIPYYVYSGTIKSFDIDNDGKLEEIAAYEDESLNGKVTIFSKDGLIKADQTTEYFGGKCSMSFISGYGPQKESLIILDTAAERDCEILSYSNGNLISMLPPNQSEIVSEANVTFNDQNILLSIPQKGISYDCLLPESISKSYLVNESLPQYRFAINVKPIISNTSLSLVIRHSLQLKMYQEPMTEDTNTYFDIAQIINEYQYLGGGKWEFLSTKGGPKYDSNSLNVELSANDFTIGEIRMLALAKEIASDINLDLTQYTDEDLMAGVLYKSEGVCVGIMNDRISYISLEKNSDAETIRGLNIQDAKQQALSLYGLPDKGYFEDSVWTYYYMREENMEEGSYTSADTLNIEFDSDRVSKIWMSMYLPVY